MDVSQYLEIFIEESKEHLQSLNDTLLILEKEPNDIEKINEVFRVAHTFKGMAGTMGFKRMNNLTHNMENVLSEIRNGKITISSSLLDILFQCLDALEQYVDNIINTSGEGDETYQDIIDDLAGILEANGMGAGKKAKEESESKPAQEVKAEEKKDKSSEDKDFIDAESFDLNEYEKNAINKAKESNLATFYLRFVISKECLLKSARAFIIFRALEDVGDLVRSNPSVQDIENEKFEDEFYVILVTDREKVDLLKEFEGISEVTTIEIKEIRLEAVEGEISDQDVEDDELKKADPKKAAKNTQAQKPKASRTVRVDIDRLDNLMNLVSELIIVKNGLEMVSKNSQGTNEQIEYLERITTNLHDAVMKVRMVPVERVFNRFPRLIRDLSRKLNKKMELHMTGEETELDRTVIDEIGDPLVHLIRNSADHGLETPTVREAAGKDPIGKVFLEAYQDGNNVVIEVGDDGNGIDVNKIKAKAIGKNIITKEQAEGMANQEVIDLLFRPSFSMAEKISDVSGRGVGLDVVKTKIESLGGDIEVKSKLGKGSRFIIRLPLTLAIIQALMVKVGEEKYAIPLGAINTIEDVSLTDIKYIQNKEVIHLRDKVIPIVHLDQLLQIERKEDKKDNMTVVIVSKAEKQVGLLVDELIGQQEIVIKTLGQFLMNIKLIAGATILGNGDVALILDVNALI